MGGGGVVCGGRGCRFFFSVKWGYDDEMVVRQRMYCMYVKQVGLKCVFDSVAWG